MLAQRGPHRVLRCSWGLITSALGTIALIADILQSETIWIFIQNLLRNLYQGLPALHRTR